MPATPVLNAKKKGPAHDLTLTDGVRTYGFVIPPANIQEIPQTPSTLRLVAGGSAGNKYGDFEPSMAHVEQRDWSGGRGLEYFADDPSRFFDSQNAWTLTPNRLIPGPQITYGQGLTSANVHLPAVSSAPGGFFQSNLKWVSLLSTARYLAVLHLSTSNLTADQLYAWIRRIGSPGTLTFEIRTDSAGRPSTTVLQTVTKTVSNVTDLVSLFQSFNWSGTETLTNSTSYWLVFYGASTDNSANCWQVAVDPEESDSTKTSTSSNGTSWSGSTVGVPWFLVVDNTAARRFLFFELDQALYCVDRAEDGATATKLYLNGARGKATSAAATTLTDTNQAWVVNRFTEAVIKIIKGTGAYQVRSILSNTATQVTVSVAWDVTPDATSVYVIYNTHTWQEITGHGLGAAVVSDVCVVNRLPGIAYFAQGDATNIRRMRFDDTAAPPAHGFAADGTNKADLLHTFYDSATKETVVWRALNSTATGQVSRAPAVAWGTDLTFAAALTPGTTQYKITNLIDYNSVLYVPKEDSLWTIVNNEPERVNVGLESSPHVNNGQAAVVVGLFLYFNYMHSIERLYGSTLDDVGPWRGTGIPSGRNGVVSKLIAAFAWVFAAIDGGTGGTSSVMMYDGRGWHEIFRAFESGQRIRDIWWQACEGGRPHLWIDSGNRLYFLEFPKDTLNPLNDSTFRYHHEGILVGGTYDFGSVSLPKFFKELTAFANNLDTGTYVAVDYQLDDDIGGSTWTHLGSILQSPEDTLPINAGNRRQIRTRLRMITDDADVPPEIRGTVLEGYARTPVKYQYLLKVKERPKQLNRRGGRDVDPDVVYAWLREAANGATRIRMRSRYASMDNRDVIVEPPTLLRSAVGENNQWTGVLNITLRDA